MAGASLSISAKIDPETNAKLNIQLNSIQLKMIKIGGITNIVSGIFVIWILKNTTSLTLLFYWYSALVIINIVNITFSLYFERKKLSPESFNRWKNYYHVILGILCLVWSSMFFLFPVHNVHYQFFYAALLFSVIVGFSFGTITDFRASIISIACLTIPTIIFKIYTWRQSILTLGYDPDISLGFITTVVVLALFLLATCYVGYILIRRSLTLTLINISLTKQLENVNKTLEKRVEERTKELHHQATHDSLTGLPNQTVLFKRIENAISEAKTKDISIGIAFFSINQMELFINAFGYKMWNQIIHEIAKRLYYQFEIQNSVPNCTYQLIITRRDEFAIIIDPLSSESEIDKVKILHKVLEKPIVIDGNEIRLNASIGVSIYPEHGQDPRALLMNADAAMLQGRREFAAGDNVVFYKANITSSSDVKRKLQLLNSLESAVEKHEFNLVYQPFVNLYTGRICGFEALTRWSHSTFGMVSPDEFIPLIQISQKLFEFDRWVIKTATAQANAWQKQGFANLKVAVNLSETFLKQENIVEIISNLLSENAFNPKNLEIELVETIAFGEAISANFEKLHDLGIKFSIDDYGTGLGDLGKLRAEQFSKIKIDKAFVNEMIKDERSKLIVLNAIKLAKDMKMIILAEGVETIEQLDFLQENGCDMIQGYIFSKPINAELFTQLLIDDKVLSLPSKKTS